MKLERSALDFLLMLHIYIELVKSGEGCSKNIINESQKIGNFDFEKFNESFEFFEKNRMLSYNEC